MLQFARVEGPAASIAFQEPGADELTALGEEFATRHCVVLRGLMGPAVFAELAAELEAADFHHRQIGDIAGELSIDEGRAPVARLNFLANDPGLYRTIEAITGVRPIRRFDGRVYRRTESPDHFDSWHDDLHVPSNLVPMSVNLSPEPYGGGELAIRERDSGRILHEIRNVGPGDAIVFRIAPGLQHRVGPVIGPVAKTAFAGWFRSGPPWPVP